MNVAVDELVNAVLKKPLRECSLLELQELAQQYPYFGPAHLLLAKKLSLLPGEEDNSSQYEEQVQKTSLYFQNRVWLDYLLNSSVSDSPVAPGPVAEKELPETMIASDPHAELATLQEDKVEDIVVPVHDEIAQTDTVPTHSAVHNEIDEHQSAGEKTESETIAIAGKADPEEQHKPAFELASLKIEPLREGGLLAFEPYHTVDYFASQGIKFKEDEKPKDRFSSQLKSFTEWLKTMKKVPAGEIAAAAGDSQAEKKIEQMAEYSVAERHVITEAMAEVWQKQGNRAKAEEIYRKLSLLDPSKSSYFATKIDELKKTS